MLFWVFMLLLLFYRNHSEKSINSILDYISTSKQMELLQNFYETTLDALRDAKVKSPVLQLEGRFSPFFPITAFRISGFAILIQLRSYRIKNFELFFKNRYGTGTCTWCIFQNGSNSFPVVNYLPCVIKQLLSTVPGANLTSFVQNYISFVRGSRKPVTSESCNAIAQFNR
jgi:hypothetical protein